MNDFSKSVLAIAKEIQEEVYEVFKPPAQGEKPKTNYVIDFNLVKDARGYHKRVVNQINGCYEHGWYDACAVMLRRLIETLIIECYEKYNKDQEIKNPRSGDFHYLKYLIKEFLKDTNPWNLSRNTKNALPQLKGIGDQSAHNRRYNANRQDIERLLPHIRIVVEELLYVAELK